MSATSPAVSASSARTLIDRVETLRRGHPERALAALERDFARAARSASPHDRGELWRLRGHVLRGLRRAADAAQAYARAESSYGRARETREQGRCAIGWVDALLYLGRYAEAMRVARRGRRRLAAAKDGVSLGRLLNNEANVLHRLDLPEAALARYREARRSLGRLGDAYERAQMGVNVGNCLSLLGRCGEARGFYREARDAAGTRGRPLDALRAEYNLAYLDFLEHRHEAALAALAKIGAESERRGYPSIAALARLDRAEIFLRLSAHAEALDEARAAIAACGALDLRYERAKAETFAALAAFRLGRPRGAATRLEKALDEFHAEGNEVWTGEALLGLATVWWSERQPLAAAALLQAAALHFGRARDREREGCARALVVRARLAAGDRRGAGRARARLHARRDRVHSPRQRQLRAAAEAAWARATGDVDGARRALEGAATESERLAARILDEQWRASFWGEWGWPHRALATLELEHRRYAAALEALERGRGRALLGTEIHAGRARAIAGRVRTWAAARYARDRERNARAGAGAVAAPGAVEPPPIRRALARRPAGRLSASRIRASLPPGVVLLDYLSEDDRVSVIAASNDLITGRVGFARERTLVTLAHRVLFALRSAAFGAEDHGRADVRALDAELEALAAQALWPALETWGTCPAALAIAPVGPLARIPWAALPLPDGRRLCEAAALVLVPGLRLGLAPSLAQATTSAAARPLVIASDAGRLDQVAREVREIAERFPAAEVLEGEGATVARFLERAPQAPWIHFAGHGLYRPESPNGSGLQLADGWLAASELSTTRFTADRVVLSACQSARALVQPGEEWFGLARTLLLGGARRVVAAQWDIDDDAARSFMAAWYARLAAGEPAAPALARVQAERAGAGAHAIDWAGFVTLGGPEALL